MNRLRQSEIGIGSFIVSIISVLLMIILIVVAGIMETQTPGGLDDEAPELYAIGFAFIGCSLMVLLGLGLGIGAMFHPGRRNTFGIIGIVISSITIVGTTFLMILGSTMP